MIEVKAPEYVEFDTDEAITIFLAGSIEMGKAEPWQERLAAELSGYDCILYNPRRTDWDSSWVQDPAPGTQFNQQVTWELEHINEADLVVFYFDPNTQSPITLLELGYVLGAGIPTVVCCPDGYFRKGNVVITCDMVGERVFDTFEELVEEVKSILEDNSFVDI
jgi:nucleoside 2-deoxyribosyltransferase